VLRALIWDVDGTVAETERDGHRVAFNRAFEEAGAPWRWDVAEYAELLEVTGGRERILAYLKRRADAPVREAEREALARRLHPRKNAVYAELVAQGGIAARPGVLRLMDECRAEGVALAIATTTGRANVDALFASQLGGDWEARFGAVVCAEDAPDKKPLPQAYRLALQRLGVSAGEAFALEDSPNGLKAARAAGIACGVTRSAYFADAHFEGAAWVRDDLDAPPPVTLATLRAALLRGAS
jgi:HAD superfamily hydrolase (TIGR01509 family)